MVFRASTTPKLERELPAGTDQAIPPGVVHEVWPSDDAAFSIEFFQVVPGECPDPVPWAGADGLGGDPACWAHLFCPECGAELAGPHVPGCPNVGTRRKSAP